MSANIGELFRALGVLSEPPEAAHRRVAAALEIAVPLDPAAYTELFGGHLYPYASVYLGAEGMLGGEARDRIAGFWRALRLTPPAEPDHLAALLGLYAALLDREAGEDDSARRLSCRHARSSLLWEHLLPWLPPYLDRMDDLAPAAYRAWGALLHEALLAEAESLERPALLSAHLREAPPLPDPRRDGSHAFAAGLFAPVRCGMILTRADLARAARDLGLALRMGERKFILAALLAQAPDAVLGWLAGEAEARRSQHVRREAAIGPIAGFWAARASAAAALLLDLRGEALGDAAAG
jgi:TorA maturation chaperone TorD